MKIVSVVVVVGTDGVKRYVGPATGSAAAGADSALNAVSLLPGGTVAQRATVSLELADGAALPDVGAIVAPAQDVFVAQ